MSIVAEMSKKLTLDQIEQYHADGYCSPVEVMSEAAAAELKARLEQAENQYPEVLGPTNRNNTHLVLKCMDEVAFHPEIVNAVEDLLGPDLLLWGSVLFIKEPRTTAFVSWHQDATYMALEPHDFVTPWLALTPRNAESGCMRVIPGSHKSAIKPHQDTFVEDNILTRGQNINEVDDSQAIDIVLRPGQMSMHHPRLVHSSKPNLSNHRRIGVALQSYMTSAVSQTGFPGYALPVRGHSEQSNFQLGRRPDEDMTADAIRW